MSLEQLWHIYGHHGYAAASATTPTDALDMLYLGLLAFGEQQFAQAASWAQQAATYAPHDRVFVEAATYLARMVEGSKEGVYVSGDGFGAFIRGGGNVPLYAATSAALRQIYHAGDQLSLLDIGVGDGQALIPALAPTLRRVDVVEPSAVLLERVDTRLAEHHIAHRTFATTAQAFVEQANDQWDITQATWSLQTIAPAERLPILRWLHIHTRRMLIAEFDVPQWSDLYTPDRVRYVVDRYRRGLAEYANDGSFVAQQFLLPVMFGYFDRTVARSNYEQPIKLWREQLEAAGFATVTTHELYPYWWASAYLLDAC